MNKTPTSAEQHPAPRPLRFLRLPDVLERVALSKSTVYSRVRAKTFPKPVHLGTTSVWVESEIEAWISARIAERGASQEYS
ncbi:helix-turn-helix transcriptional regulator [Xanthomonas oryzae]|uniref:helix-turn-helix transcriptional regulator n=1 Tax=Xanthomonas oryzae TaxID=347 RepID=UPI0010334E91|nr:AlpA family transcriptional regulator [Xanthomonas oryzae]